MPFRVKNGPPTYHKPVAKVFHEYIDVFMKIFLDDFTIFSDISTHLEKLKKCFLKCREYGINLNPETCAFMVCSGTILGFIVYKKGKTLNPKKIKALVNMLIPETPQEKFKSSMEWHNSIGDSSKKLPLLWHQSPSYSKKLKCSSGLFNVKPLGKTSKTNTFKLLYSLVLNGN
jgi:hypothetical protein